MGHELTADAQGAASEGELRALRDSRERLGSELERLKAELAQARRDEAQGRRDAHARALRHAEHLGELRDQAQEAQDHAARVQAELDEQRRSQAEAVTAQLNAELGRLREEINHVSVIQQKTTRELWELRRDHTAALAGLTRPGPVAGPPAGTPARVEQDYLTAALSGLMDARWYRAHHPDVARSGIDPILHYLEYGWREGRRPGPAFDGAAYLAANPDLASLEINPLVHYQTAGAVELRAVSPPPSPDLMRRSVTAEPSASRPSNAQLWFYAGDLIEWLRDHPHLTGVGRVTSELLFAALLDAEANTRLCVMDEGLPGVAQLSDASPILDLARRSSHDFSASELSTIKAAFSRPMRRPQRDDHVIFTGVVWTQQYIDLFKRLASDGVNFSLLVHDIIPLQLPPQDDGEHARVFDAWLRTALETATAIYVSNHSVAEDIARWAVVARVRPRARIVQIGFGSRPVAAPARKPAPDGVEAKNFVLCVGTIDPRKNQRGLLRIWQDLVIRLGVKVCPQLVLVGRDDVKLQDDAAFRSLEAVGKVKLLTDLSDAGLAALYKSCLFTAFPSTSEGYGLPVAESLGHGKLCVASDLPPIRAHAGDLVWYFDPASLADAIATFERAITSPSDVQAACARIVREHAARNWSDTFTEMRGAVERSLDIPARIPRGRERGAYAGQSRLLDRAVLKRAATWCVDDHVEVSIIVLNWNAAALTMDCIRQVWAATEGVRYEILIADNGSEEREISPLRNLGRGVRLIEIGCNRFFGEANNIAAEAARGRFVLLLNNDAFVEEGAILALLRGFTDHSQAGAVGPLFRFPDGRVQEAGGFVNAEGYPTRAGRDELELGDDLRQDREVDYISAAALLIDKKLFLDVGGFDLRYEPAYYEDTDLCFKIKLAGRSIICKPDAVVVHIEGASANGDTAAELRRKHLGDLNRSKFAARWGDYLRSRDEAGLSAVRRKLMLDGPGKRIDGAGHAVARERAIVFTPEPLTPGGGERYLLTLAEILSKDYAVSLVTPHPYSRLRILDLAAGFGLDLSTIDVALEADADWDGASLQVVMGNHIVPPAPARARVNLFHCQFPFQLREPPSAAKRTMLNGYHRIVVNSRFTSLHVEAALNGLQLPDIPITVLPPPSDLIEPGVKGTRPIKILSVGRFFQGGHSKRQDLLIAAFKTLEHRCSSPLELHLAGSSHPAPENMAYLSELMAAARWSSISFHVNAAPDDLAALYSEASIYWHAAGLGSDLVREPWAAEHFGISIVEAMSAAAVPFALASGGAREIIEPGVNGFLYDTETALLDQTLAFISEPASRRAEVGAAAAARARDFSKEAFATRLAGLLGDVGSEP